MTKRKITMSIDGVVFAAFKRFCSANGMKVSARTEIMMRDFVANDQRLKRPPEKDGGDQ